MKRNINVMLLIALLHLSTYIDNAFGYENSAIPQANSISDNALRETFTDVDLKLIKDKLSNLNAKKLNEIAQQTTDNVKLRKRSAVDSVDITKINARLQNYLYQGDMLLTPDQIDAIENEEHSISKRQAINGRRLRTGKWSSPIAYSFHYSITSQAQSLIKKAIKLWENNTCITFEEDESADNVIEFEKGQGCFSTIGKSSRRRKQTVSIGDGCDHIGIIAHEIGHALGLFHLHSRFDRDKYVEINADNINQETLSNFDKQTRSTSQNFGVPFDYGSVMSYSTGSFAIDKSEPAISPKDDNHKRTMGQRISPAFNDFLIINRLFECEAECSVRKTCERGGFQNPKNCDTCICPWGFGGNSCETRKKANKGAKCGKTLKATNDWQTLEVRFGSDTGITDSTATGEYEECHWHIQAPRGNKVILDIEKIEGTTCTEDCFWGHLEFKVKSDFTVSGYRYCCETDAPKKLQTKTNLAVVSAYSHGYSQAFKLRYKTGAEFEQKSKYKPYIFN